MPAEIYLGQPQNKFSQKIRGLQNEKSEMRKNTSRFFHEKIQTQKSEVRGTIGRWFFQLIQRIRERVFGVQPQQGITYSSFFLEGNQPRQKEAMRSIILARMDDLDRQQKQLQDEKCTKSMMLKMHVKNEIFFSANQLLEIKDIINNNSKKIEEIKELSLQYISLLEIFNDENKDLSLQTDVIKLLNDLQEFSKSLAVDAEGKRVFLGREFFFYYSFNAIFPDIHYTGSQTEGDSSKSKQIIVPWDQTPQTLDEDVNVENLVDIILKKMGDAPRAALCVTNLSAAHYTVSSFLIEEVKLSKLIESFATKGYILSVDKEGINQPIPAKGNCLLETACVCLRYTSLVKKPD